MAACGLEAALQLQTAPAASTVQYFCAYLLHVFPVVLTDIFGNFSLRTRSQLASV